MNIVLLLMVNDSVGSGKIITANISTYDGISLYILMAVISGAGLLILGIYNRKKFN